MNAVHDQDVEEIRANFELVRNTDNPVIIRLSKMIDSIRAQVQYDKAHLPKDHPRQR